MVCDQGASSARTLLSPAGDRVSLPCLRPCPRPRARVPEIPRQGEKQVGPRCEWIGVLSMGRLSVWGRYHHRIGRLGGVLPEGEVFRAGPLNLALASC